MYSSLSVLKIFAGGVTPQNLDIQNIFISE